MFAPPEKYKSVFRALEKVAERKSTAPINIVCFYFRPYTYLDHPLYMNPGADC
jgi:hypothetical protein